ncbi:hypothetical protein NLJ89_g7217 [Agrocybe chaxingu]|uniref:F-box domain-containing protein n=1 Tax=Agrocybe chaxingu TaxID=84603 RepID=A0A9W8JXR7_9AGAR|nr:hypothetical protein NLJ89_g7217 [Agrocybe chaxingu]
MQAEILKLPPETLDIITSFVDNPLDLGHLRAACKFFLALISPSHIQLRVIRAPLLSPVWQRLVEKPSLAQHVRVIEVQPEPTPRDVVDDPVIPAIFDDLVSPPSAKGESIYEQALEAERVFVSALKAMVYLTSFKWSRMSPVIDPSLEDGVCTVLAKYLPRLENVDVLDCTNVPSWPTPGATSSKLQLHRWTDCLPVFSIKGMKEFILGVYDFSFRPNALELDKLFIMLRASPGLAVSIMI